jgi:hypothetical protein
VSLAFNIQSLAHILTNSHALTHGITYTPGYTYTRNHIHSLAISSTHTCNSHLQLTPATHTCNSLTCQVHATYSLRYITVRYMLTHYCQVHAALRGGTRPLRTHWRLQTVGLCDGGWLPLLLVRADGMGEMA